MVWISSEARNRKQIAQPACACFHSFRHTCCFWQGLKLNDTCFVTGQYRKSKENIIRWALLSLSAHVSLCSPSLAVVSYFLLFFLFSLTEHVYTYISKHMFLVSHSHVQCLRYSPSSGRWLTKDPLNLGGVFWTLPSGGTSRPRSRASQDVAPKTDNAKSPSGLWS